MLYISTKFREIISNSIKVIERTPFLYWKLEKGNNSEKNVGGVNIVNLCKSSGHALYLCQLSWNYLERYQSYRADTISIWKITKGNNSTKSVGGVNIVNLCKSSGHALYLCQLSWNYLERYQSYRADTISILKITKGNNSAKNASGATVVNLCTSSDHALYFYQILWNYLKPYQSYRADTISIPKISKGNNSAKNVGGVTVVNLCTSSDRALHLYQVSWNYLERYQSYGPDRNVQPLTDGRTDRQKFGGYNIIPRHFLWWGIKKKNMADNPYTLITIKTACHTNNSIENHCLLKYFYFCSTYDTIHLFSTPIVSFSICSVFTQIHFKFMYWQMSQHRQKVGNGRQWPLVINSIIDHYEKWYVTLRSRRLI